MNDWRNKVSNHKTILGMPIENLDNDFDFVSSLENKLASLVDWYVNGDLLKISYPNDIGYLSVPGQYDTSRWIQSLKDLYHLQSNGMKRSDALARVAGDWSDTEKFNFLSWLRFYESQDHLKYKKANLWYHGSEPGYFLPVKPDSQSNNLPKAKDLLSDINNSKDELEQLSTKEKKSIIEAQRKKVISRLDAVEKLLRSDAGQLLSGDDYDTLIQSIYELKRKINKINKLAKRSTIFSDIIVRHGNVLSKQGHYNSAAILYKVAEDVAEPLKAPADGSAPLTSPAPAPTQNVGNPGTLPSDGPETTQLQNNTPDLSKGLQQFLDNLKTDNITDIKDLQEADDILEVEDEMYIDDFEFHVQAQAATGDAVKQVSEIKPTTIETPKQSIVPATKNVDDMIGNALSNVSIEDLIDKLQNLAKLFKTREIPRQLAIVDLMMNSLGIAPYFHNLSECINKATESNNYILTRIEDMLGKLTGVANYGEGIDLIPSEKPETPLSGALKAENEKEKARKQMKKELANKALDEQVSSEKEVPEVEIEEEAPVSSPTPAATPTSTPAPTKQPTTTPATI